MRKTRSLGIARALFAAACAGAFSCSSAGPSESSDEAPVGPGDIAQVRSPLLNVDWTFNVMSYNYSPNPSNIQQRTPAISLSQVEQIRRVLTFDVPTDKTSSSGAVIFGDWRLLGR